MLRVRRLLVLTTLLLLALLLRLRPGPAADTPASDPEPAPAPPPRGPVVLLGEAEALGANWAVWTVHDTVQWATLDEARTACAGLGARWALPASGERFPALRPWPSLPATVPLWTSDGATITLEASSPNEQEAADTLSSRFNAVLCAR